MNPIVVIAGGLMGLGVFLFIRELRPAPPRLDAVLSSLDGAGPLETSRPDDERTPPLGEWLVRRVAVPTGLPIPRRDLDLLGTSVERFALNKLYCLLLGLLMPSVPAMAAMAGGMAVPLAVPAATALVTGLLLFLAPDIAVRVDAGKRRAEFRRALTSYLDFVALERAAGSHPNQALEAAAAISDAWAFRRIASVLERARRAQVAPWEGLARLGEEIGIDELSDIAEIAQLAGNEGAKILDTLMAKADSMRRQQLAEAQSGANANTTTMVIPVALLGLGFLVLLAFPVVYRMAAV